MEPQKDKLYVFDVCGTLYHSNTAYDFLLFYFKRKNSAKYLICRVALSYPFKALIRLLGKIGMQVQMRSFLIHLLSGERVDEVAICSEAFVDGFLAHKKNPKTHEILCNALQEHQKVILVSASLDPVVKSIAAKTKVRDYLAVLLTPTDMGTYSGKLAFDIKGEKLAALQQAMDLVQFDVIVLTDNLDDISLVNYAKKAFVVSKSRTLGKWNRLLLHHPDAEILHI